MKTKHEAYKLAADVDALISKHLATYMSCMQEVSKNECYNVLLYLRTIQTSITLCTDMTDSRLECIQLEKQNKE